MWTIKLKDREGRRAIPHDAYIYLLWVPGRPLYAGTSRHVRSRLGQHLNFNAKARPEMLDSLMATAMTIGEGLWAYAWRMRHRAGDGLRVLSASYATWPHQVEQGLIRSLLPEWNLDHAQPPYATPRVPLDFARIAALAALGEPLCKPMTREAFNDALEGLADEVNYMFFREPLPEPDPEPTHVEYEDGYEPLQRAG